MSIQIIPIIRMNGLSESAISLSTSSRCDSVRDVTAVRNPIHLKRGSKHYQQTANRRRCFCRIASLSWDRREPDSYLQLDVLLLAVSNL